MSAYPLPERDNDSVNTRPNAKARLVISGRLYPRQQNICCLVRFDRCCGSFSREREDRGENEERDPRERVSKGSDLQRRHQRGNSLEEEEEEEENEGRLK